MIPIRTFVTYDKVSYNVANTQWTTLEGGLHIYMESQKNYKQKKSMSVFEMGRLLGLTKTTSYWLVKKGYFKTVIVGGKTRVMIDSYEKWYDQQSHYKKVDVHKDKEVK